MLRLDAMKQQLESGSVTVLESGQQKLVYDNSFRKMLRERVGIVREAIALVEEADERYSPENIIIGAYECRWNSQGHWDIIKENGVEVATPIPIRQRTKNGRGVYFKPGTVIANTRGDLKVVMLGKSNREWERPKRLVHKSAYFKITFKGKTLFVKRATATNNPAAEEFLTTIKAKDALKKLPFVRTVNPQLAYHDTKQSWFVCEWENLETEGYAPFVLHAVDGYDDYGNTVERFDKADPPKNRLEWHMMDRYEEIEVALAVAGIDTADILYNLFYNPNTDTFVYLDITTKESGQIGY